MKKGWKERESKSQRLGGRFRLFCSVLQSPRIVSWRWKCVSVQLVPSQNAAPRKVTSSPLLLSHFDTIFARLEILCLCLVADICDRVFMSSYAMSLFLISRLNQNDCCVIGFVAHLIPCFSLLALSCSILNISMDVTNMFFVTLT